MRTRKNMEKKGGGKKINDGLLSMNVRIVRLQFPFVPRTPRVAARRPVLFCRIDEKAVESIGHIDTYIHMYELSFLPRQLLKSARAESYSCVSTSADLISISIRLTLPPRFANWKTARIRSGRSTTVRPVGRSNPGRRLDLHVCTPIAGDRYRRLVADRL